ncbi:lipase family protein [Corynebacterium heidelbergense]|uniref:lipase family protein n=1 Tax=Corynebacterium heidelbergense TaxID=2055947 RepID=UPI001EE6D83C|nr:lipase family protein [Corynebacterium heidelbergense]
MVTGQGEKFGKVGFYGYCQGGGASAAAVEEAASYAPDLEVAGAYDSAPPVDLSAVQRNIDGSDLVGAIGFTINSVLNYYPQLKPVLAERLSDQGMSMLDHISNKCTNEITDVYGHQHTSE